MSSSTEHNDKNELSPLIPQPKNVYKVSLRKEAFAYLQLTNNVFALKYCNENGSLSYEYVILQRTYDYQINEEYFICSCGEENCWHIGEIPEMCPPYIGHIDDASEEFECEFLSDKLIGIYCKLNNSYSILNHAKIQTKCLTCFSSVKSCIHMKAYLNFNKNNDIPNIRTQQTFPSISKELIQYPFDNDYDKKMFADYASNKARYNENLFPDYRPDERCIHGNSFHQDCKFKRKCTLHLPHIDLQCNLFIRPAIGCDCYLDFDGRSQHLINLDNRHIYPYTWLMDILHNTQETRFPLHAAFRSAKRTRMAVGQPKPTSRLYETLRYCYNSFIRLLDIQYEDLYKCEICGIDPDTLVMVGIMMGSREDPLPKFEIPSVPFIQVEECSIKDRVFVRNSDTRRLLSIYAGRSKNTYEKDIKRITETDYTNLHCQLSSNISLQSVVLEAGNPCPKSLQKLMGELSRDSPTCGIFQIAGNNEGITSIGIRTVLSSIVTADDITASRIIPRYKVLFEKKCPLLLEFLLSEEIHILRKINLLKDLLISVDAPFTNRVVPDQNHYGPSSESHQKLEFFPNKPLLRGTANYKADAANETITTGCRKESHRHPTLTPGLFTMFCPHAVCYGFQVMQNSESPKTAFDLLVRRFEKMPRYLIYDNSCKLHLYALKREPIRFQNTQFMVDRLHYSRGHVGCSLGYSMDTYASDIVIKSINSQANEQANARLRLLTTQAVSMSPENMIHHTKVFLALRNMDKNSELYCTRTQNNAIGEFALSSLRS